MARDPAEPTPRSITMPERRFGTIERAHPSARAPAEDHSVGEVVVREARASRLAILGGAAIVSLGLVALGLGLRARATAPAPEVALPAEGRIAASPRVLAEPHPAVPSGEEPRGGEPTAEVGRATHPPANRERPRRAASTPSEVKREPAPAQPSVTRTLLEALKASPDDYALAQRLSRALAEAADGLARAEAKTAIRRCAASGMLPVDVGALEACVVSLEAAEGAARDGR